MKYIKYNIGTCIYYVLDNPLVKRTFSSFLPPQQKEMADMVVENNILIKSRYSIESILDDFIGVNNG